MMMALRVAALLTVLAPGGEITGPMPRPAQGAAGSPSSAPGQPRRANCVCATTQTPCPPDLTHYCQVGCPGPHPRLVTRVPPDLRNVARPYPSGVVILEAAIDEDGNVVSACVLRGVRADFDKGAQRAVLRWRWKQYPQRGIGRKLGVVATVTVCTPDLDCASKPSSARGYANDSPAR